MAYNGSYNNGDDLKKFGNKLNLTPAKASTTGVAKKSEPFSYNQNTFNKIANQEKEKKEVNRMQEKEEKEVNRMKKDMISRGKWEERHNNMSSKQLISEQLN